jgi:hypothetical protein
MALCPVLKMDCNLDKRLMLNISKEEIRHLPTWPEFCNIKILNS